VLARLRELLVGDDLRPYEVASARVHQQSAILQLTDVDSVEAAVELRGQLLSIPAEAAARPRRGEHFVHDIEGLRVQTEKGRELGTIREILRTGANDVYVLEGPLGEVLIPAIADVVRKVDVGGGRIVVRLLPGLLPGED
jgi:16S rRNA processing protein RimM